MNTKVNMTVDYLRELLAYARRAGTLDAWADCAMEWMEGADEQIFKLTEESTKLYDEYIDAILADPDLVAKIYPTIAKTYD